MYLIKEKKKKQSLSEGETESLITIICLFIKTQC